MFPGYPVPQPQIEARKLRPGDTINGVPITKIDHDPQTGEYAFHRKDTGEPVHAQPSEMVKGARRRPSKAQ